MPIKFKLVGQTSNKKYYEITDNFEGPINLNLLQELFKFHGLDSNEIEKVRFIIDSEQIKNSENSYNIKADEYRGIFVFTSEIEIRTKLQEIFMKNGKEIDTQQQTSPRQISHQSVIQTVIPLEQFEPLTNNNFGKVQVVNEPYLTLSEKLDSSTILKNEPVEKQSFSSATLLGESKAFPNNEPYLTLSDKLDSSTMLKNEPVMTPEIIDTMNKKTVNLFSQPDFKTLLNIFLTNPGVIRDFSKYVQHCDIIVDSNNNSWEELSIEKQIEYNHLADKLEEFNLGKPRELLLSRLVKYSGHLNLTLRSILSE
jgi:hypothetical protein